MEPKERIIVALDVGDVESALELVDQLKDLVGGFKFGLQFINTMLVSVVDTDIPADSAIYRLRRIRRLFKAVFGKLFWDGKFDDIPNTVGAATKILSLISPKMINVHASAGQEALNDAVGNRGYSLVLGVTVLTSIDKKECRSIFGDEPGAKVLQFAGMLLKASADGIICSAKELDFLKKRDFLDELIAVTPGIRPKWAVAGDQKRITTPALAVKAGADYLVIGRPITKPPEEIGTPVDAAEKIAEEIAGALK